MTKISSRKTDIPSSVAPLVERAKKLLIDNPSFERVTCNSLGHMSKPRILFDDLPGVTLSEDGRFEIAQQYDITTDKIFVSVQYRL